MPGNEANSETSASEESVTRLWSGLRSLQNINKNLGRATPFVKAGMGLLKDGQWLDNPSSANKEMKGFQHSVKLVVERDVDDTDAVICVTGLDKAFGGGIPDAAIQLIPTASGVGQLWEKNLHIKFDLLSKPQIQCQIIQQTRNKPIHIEEMGPLFDISWMTDNIVISWPNAKVVTKVVILGDAKSGKATLAAQFLKTPHVLARHKMTRKSGRAFDLRKMGFEIFGNSFVFLDVAGHPFFLKELMAAVDCVMVVVDMAAEDHLCTVKQHFQLLQQLRTSKQYLLVCTKMDRVGFSEEEYNKVVAVVEGELGGDVGLTCVPVTIHKGMSDNLYKESEHMPWFQGVELAAALVGIHKRVWRSAEEVSNKISSSTSRNGEVVVVLVAGMIESGTQFILETGDSENIQAECVQVLKQLDTATGKVLGKPAQLQGGDGGVLQVKPISANLPPGSCVILHQGDMRIGYGTIQ